MSKKIFLYRDKENECDFPSISKPYKDLNQFLKENRDEFLPLVSYDLDHLLDRWDVKQEIDDLKLIIKSLGHENLICDEYIASLKDE